MEMGKVAMKATAIALLLGGLLYGNAGIYAFDAVTHDLAEVSPVLHMIGQNWQDLSPQERSRALENYRRFQKLPPERQRNLEDQYNRWMQLPNEEQERIRRNYDRYRKMDSDQKEEFYRKYKTWQGMPR